MTNEWLVTSPSGRTGIAPPLRTTVYPKLEAFRDSDDEVNRVAAVEIVELNGNVAEFGPAQRESIVTYLQITSSTKPSTCVSVLMEAVFLRRGDHLRVVLGCDEMDRIVSVFGQAQIVMIRY